MMFRLLLPFALMALSMGQYQRPLIYAPYPENFLQFSPLIKKNVKLCTYSEISYQKCSHTVAVARTNSIPLALACVRHDSRENCINSVQHGKSDIVVLTGHGYKEARNKGLRPLVFAKEDDHSLYIAVAPRNITLIGIQEAPIIFDQSNHRAFHAAVYFNLRMGHDICSFLDKTSRSSYIAIVDSDTYEANSREVLICPDRVPNEFKNYKRCNVEATLQRAVFIRTNTTPKEAQDVVEIFETIIKSFGESSQVFKFFDTFQGQDDVIFKKKTVSLDFAPTYRNGVNENVFNELHCHQNNQPHDLRALV